MHSMRLILDDEADLLVQKYMLVAKTRSKGKAICDMIHKFAPEIKRLAAHAVKQN